MPLTSVTREKGDGWDLITLSSPAGLNKLGSDTLVPLQEQITSAISGGCRCLGITGTGGSFAVGADLREIGSLTPATARRFSDLGNSIFRTLECADVMVVAGVDGFCLGGGLDLALAADWRTASSRSVFGHPGAQLGLITGFGGTQRLPRLIGTGRARKLLYTAERINAGEAYVAGLIQEMSSDDEFQEVLMKRIRTFAGLTPEWIREVKQGFRYGGDKRYASGRACVRVR